MKSDVLKMLKKEKEKTAFGLLFLVMAVYYAYRMFELTPWYDELYTYYYFISRGPVYAAIHWPLPNNHVGYSVLSGFLDFLGNPYIGLRGISYLCALANMVLLFTIGRRFLTKGLSFVAVLLYISLNLVNQLAVQGRGYTLGVTCYLTAFLCLIHICTEKEDKRRYYIIFALSLVLALYTLTSDVYFVIPICLTGGIYLLYGGISEVREKGVKRKESIFFKKLIKLIAASFAAALMTVGLYTVIWLAIGSNLLVKEEAGAYFGMGHVEVILKAPFKAIGTGMEYMLATPYIQSVERAGFLKRLFAWFQNLFQLYYDGLSAVIFVLFLSGVVILAFRTTSGVKNREKDTLLLPIFLFVGIVCTPLFLLIQCALPYYRVFVYGGVLLALLIVYFIQQLWEKAVPKAAKIIKAVFITGIMLLAGYYFFFTGYSGQYGMREYEIQDALSYVDWQEVHNPCVTDCTQQYLIKFLYDITCENTQIEGADMVLLDKKMLDPDYQEMEWEFYHYYATIPWDYINGSMETVYENESFVLFTKKNNV